MAKEYDKNRLKRLRAIDAILSMGGRGATLMQLVEEVSRATWLSATNHPVLNFSDCHILRERLAE